MAEPDQTASGVVEVDFDLPDPSYPFVALSDTLDCRVDLAKLLPRSGRGCAEYFSVSGADPERVMDVAGAGETVDATAVTEREDGGLFEFVVGAECPASHLVAHGALPREVAGENGEGHIAAEIPAERDAAAVVAAFLADHEAAELTAKRETARCTPLFTERDLQSALDERLTDRQREVIRTAYECGYYETPRTRTGSEVAAELGVTSATFTELVRVAERRLVAILFEDGML